MATNVTSLASRASAYVAAMPPAIAGNHGHDTTFTAALALIHGFALPRAQAWPIMLEFNARCEPPWSQKELEHKLDSAAKANRHSKPRGYLLGECGPATPPQAEPLVFALDVDTSEPLPGEKRQPRKAGGSMVGHGIQSGVADEAKAACADVARQGEFRSAGIDTTSPAECRPKAKEAQRGPELTRSVPATPLEDPLASKDSGRPCSLDCGAGQRQPEADVALVGVSIPPMGAGNLEGGARKELTYLAFDIETYCVNGSKEGALSPFTGEIRLMSTAEGAGKLPFAISKTNQRTRGWSTCCEMPGLLFTKLLLSCASWVSSWASFRSKSSAPALRTGFFCRAKGVSMILAACLSDISESKSPRSWAAATGVAWCSLKSRSNMPRMMSVTYFPSRTSLRRSWILPG
jgi:hypothetical protein